MKFFFVVFEVTTDCNLNCRYCYNIWKRPGEIYSRKNSYKSAIKTLKQFFKMADVDQVTMSGGEPFLSERFSELVLFCRMKNKAVSIISNGNAASVDDYKRMKEIGVGLFEFPFHSTKPEVHDYLTRVTGSWDKSLQSIKECMALGINVVPVIVITKANCDHITDTLEYLHDQGLKQIMLNRFNIGGSGIEEKSNLDIPINILQRTFEQANNCAQRLGVILSSNVCTPACVLNPNDYPHISFSFCSNDISQRVITLDIDGNIRICNHSPVVMGNIFKNDINEIFCSPYVNEWEDSVPDYCSQCGIYEKCFGGCRAASEQLGLSLTDADPILKSTVS